jgi:hypothetical protein
MDVEPTDREGWLCSTNESCSFQDALWRALLVFSTNLCYTGEFSFKRERSVPLHIFQFLGFIQIGAQTCIIREKWPKTLIFSALATQADSTLSQYHEKYPGWGWKGLCSMKLPWDSGSLLDLLVTLGFRLTSRSTSYPMIQAHTQWLH